MYRSGRACTNAWDTYCSMLSRVGHGHRAAAVVLVTLRLGVFEMLRDFDIFSFFPRVLLRLSNARGLLACVARPAREMADFHIPSTYREAWACANTRDLCHNSCLVGRGRRAAHDGFQQRWTWLVTLSNYHYFESWSNQLVLEYLNILAVWFLVWDTKTLYKSSLWFSVLVQYGIPKCEIHAVYGIDNAHYYSNLHKHKVHQVCLSSMNKSHRFQHHQTKAPPRNMHLGFSMPY